MEIADALDVTLQNVHYHVEKLEEAGLIETTDVDYSERGGEMRVYEPVHGEVILCRDPAAKERLDRLLERLVDGSLVAVVVSAMVHVVYTRLLGLGPSAVAETGGSLRSDAGRVVDSVTSVPWWEFPSVWLLVGLLVLNAAYATWRYRRGTNVASIDGSEV